MWVGEPSYASGHIVEAMDQNTVAVHVHKSDAEAAIEKYAKEGYVLVDTTPPTIIAQAGFVRLVFLPKELADLMQPAEKPSDNDNFFARAKKRFITQFLSPHTVD